MFRRNKEPEQQGRYYVETVNLSSKFSPEKRGKLLQDALNAGDAQGWTLVSMETQGQIHVRVIIWDTNPR